VALLALRHAGAEPALEVIDPAAADRAQRVAAVSPTSRLPVLVEHGTTVWEPLAILEWAGERSPSLWPAHARRRAVARAVVAELHSGFAALRGQLPLDWFARLRLREEAPAGVQIDLHRLARIWDDLLEAERDGYLFGPRPGLADIAMVPMAARLRTYGLMPREAVPRAYAERLLALDELATSVEALSAVPALAKPPALAVPARAAERPAPAPSAAPATAPAPASEEASAPPAGGSRKLEDVVARARARGPAAPPAPPAEPAAPPPPAARAEPASPPPAPPLAAPARRSGPAEPAPPRATDGTDPPPATERGGGLGWLRRRRPETAPGGGHRRRPPRRG
jgi:glutathione S-transferase